MKVLKMGVMSDVFSYIPRYPVWSHPPNISITSNDFLLEADALRQIDGIR